MIRYVFQSGIHVRKEDIYNSSKCPICLSQKSREKVLNIQNHPKVDLLFCKNCYGSSASSMPKKEKLNEYYSKYYQNSNKKTKENISFYNAKKLAKHIAASIDMRNFRKEISILDFGGGDGSISIELGNCLQKINKNLFVKIIVIDFSNTKTISFKNMNVTFGRELNNIKTKFNIILASAVLEHIPELGTIMRILFSLMKNDGSYFYARTPFIGSIKKLFKFMDFTYPFHVHDIGCSFWNRIITTFSLKNTKAIFSRPAIPETDFKQTFIPTLISYILKFPAHLEVWLFKTKKDIFWKYYGSWEVLLLKK